MFRLRHKEHKHAYTPTHTHTKKRECLYSSQTVHTIVVLVEELRQLFETATLPSTSIRLTLLEVSPDRKWQQQADITHQKLDKKKQEKVQKPSPFFGNCPSFLFLLSLPFWWNRVASRRANLPWACAICGSTHNRYVSCERRKTRKKKEWPFSITTHTRLHLLLHGKSKETQNETLRFFSSSSSSSSSCVLLYYNYISGDVGAVQKLIRFKSSNNAYRWLKKKRPIFFFPLHALN